MASRKFCGKYLHGQYNWRHLSLAVALLAGGISGAWIGERLSGSRPVAIAQSLTPKSSNSSDFLQGLYQLNQVFLSVEPQLKGLPTELQALDQRRTTFKAQFFKDYQNQVQSIQQQLTLLETKLDSFDNETQQLAVKADLEKLQATTQNLLKLSEPFAAGFNPEAIREVQEFLDFFERRNLTEANYGFYGSVTQTEMVAYLNGQLNSFKESLKSLNELSTQAAIAPDLPTSINYLYTKLSLEQGGISTQASIAQLQAENENLRKQIANTQRIILLLPLIVMLPTTVLVFVLFYYFGKIFQEKAEQVPNYQFSINDIYGLEEELIARLTEKYELKPKLLKVRNDAFANKLISIATSDIDAAFEEEKRQQPTAKQVTAEDEATLNSHPDLVMDGDIETEAEDEEFPVHIPNIYDELVDSYNQDAKQFQKEAIALSISHQESYLDDDDEFMPMLILSKDEFGEYWATKYKSLEYLIPKAGLSVTVDNYQNFKNIFICYGYQHNTVQKAKLLKPARVAPMETEDTWELVQQGIVVLQCI